MRNFVLILISLSLGAFCDGFHISGEITSHVELETSGLNITDIVNVLNHKLTNEIQKKMDNSTQTSGYQWIKFGTNMSIPQYAFQYDEGELDKGKEYYIGRARTNNGSSVALTIIVDSSQQNISYHRSDIDLNTVEILVGYGFQWTEYFYKSSFPANAIPVSHIDDRDMHYVCFYRTNGKTSIGETYFFPNSNDGITRHCITSPDASSDHIFFKVLVI